MVDLTKADTLMILAVLIGLYLGVKLMKSFCKGEDGYNAVLAAGFVFPIIIFSSTVGMCLFIAELIYFIATGIRIK